MDEQNKKKILCGWDAKFRTTEELVAIVRGEPTTQYLNSLPFDQQVKRWLTQDNISDGQTAVPATELYSQFCEWCKKNSVDFHSHSAFGRELKEHLRWKRRNFGMVYFLNVEPSPSSPLPIPSK